MNSRIFVINFLFTSVLVSFSSCSKSDNPVSSLPIDWEGAAGKFNESYRDSILFNSSRAVGTSYAPSVHMMYRDGSGIHAVTAQWFTFAATWSPNKWKIYFVADTVSGSPSRALVCMNSDGTKMQVISQPGEDAWGVAYSPDGQKIAYIVLNSTGAGKIRVANPDGSNGQDITGFFGPSELHTVSWSSDSRRIAFDGANGGIGIVEANGANFGLLFSYSQQCWEPNWSHDGRKVAFATFTHPDTSYYTEIFVYNIATKSIQQLTSMKQAMTSGPCFSRDDQSIIFSSRGPGSSPDHLFVMNSDGTNIKQLTIGTNLDWRPSW